MTKAYKNPEFMLGRDARPLRILAEYMEPDSRFREGEVQRAVIFFGSARTRHGEPMHVGGRDYYEEARSLASRVAEWTSDRHAEPERYYICTGGGPGIMEAANRGASEHDSSLSIGLNISLPHEQNSNAYVSDDLNFEFHYFFMRKFWFLKLARALVVFPGGFGTMDELFEVLTLQQTGKKRGIPVLLFGRDFWERLIDFDLFVEEGLIAPTDLDYIHLVDNVEEAFVCLTGQLEHSTLKLSEQA